MSGHTPVPWRASAWSGVVGAAVMAQPDPAKNAVMVAMVRTNEQDAQYIAHAANAYPKIVEFVESLIEEDDTEEWLHEDEWGPDYGDKPDEAYRGGRSDMRHIISQRARDFLASMQEPDE